MIRKKRSDRNHVLYRVVCTDTGDSYIGLTVAQGQAFVRSVKIRWQKHVSRAVRENKAWTMCQFLRANAEAEFRYEVLEIVRGRKPAHQRERELITELEPTLTLIENHRNELSLKQSLLRHNDDNINTTEAKKLLQKFRIN